MTTNPPNRWMKIDVQSEWFRDYVATLVAEVMDELLDKRFSDGKGTVTDATRESS